jgi:hypothetical protein
MLVAAVTGLVAASCLDLFEIGSLLAAGFFLVDAFAVGFFGGGHFTASTSIFYANALAVGFFGGGNLAAGFSREM